MRILAAPPQIPHRFLSLVWRMDLDQKAGPQELRKFARIPPVRLDALALTLRNQRRRHDPAWKIRSIEAPLEHVSQWTRFVANLHRPVLAELSHQAAHRSRVIPDLPFHRHRFR